MKTLELNEMNLSELTDQECETKSGGWWQGVLAAAGAAIYVYNNWDDFTSGFAAGQAAYAASRRCGATGTW